MNGSAAVVVVLAVVVLVALAAMVGLGGVGLTTTSVESSDPSVVAPTDAPPASGEYGVVYSTSQTSGGFSIFGWQIADEEWAAYVAVTPPPGCETEGVGKLVPEGPCEGIAAWGEVSGGGTAIGGYEYAIISVPVSKACRDALEPGDHWPSTRTECES